MPTAATLTAPAPKAPTSAAESPAPAVAPDTQDMLIHALGAMFDGPSHGEPPATTPSGDAQPAAVEADAADAAADVLNGLTAEASEGEAPPTTVAGADTETEEKTDHEAEPGATDPKGVKKRIGSLLAEKRQLEAERAKLAEERDAFKTELETLKAEKPGVTSDDPAEAVPEIATVKQQLDKARGVKDYAKALLKRLDLDPDGVVEQLKEGKVPLKDESPEAVREWLEGVAEKAADDVADLRADLGIKKARFAEYQEAQRVQASQEAIRHYPWLRDQNSMEFKTAAQVLKTVPQLQKHPAIMLALGDMIAGAKARGAKANGTAAASAPRSAPPKSVPSVPVSAPAQPSSGGRSALRAESLKDPDAGMATFLGAVLG